MFFWGGGFSFAGRHGFFCKEPYATYGHEKFRPRFVLFYKFVTYVR